MLREGNGKQFLIGQAANGLEAALTALAKLELQTEDSQVSTRTEAAQAGRDLSQAGRTSSSRLGAHAFRSTKSLARAAVTIFLVVSRS